MPNNRDRLARSALFLASVCIACEGPTAPIGPAATIRPATATTFTTAAGSIVPGGLTVHAVDYRNRDVAGAKITFSIVAGEGTVSPRFVTTGADGIAHAEWTLSQTAGSNEVIASIQGIDSTVTFSATGRAGPAVGLAIVPRLLRLPTSISASSVSASVVDQYGNAVTGGATYVSRNTNLVSVNSVTGAVSVIGRGGTTYIVASGAGFTDSSLAIALAASDPPCMGITAMATLAIGEVMTTGFSENGICVQQTAAGGEYALVPFFESSLPSAQTVIALTAFGIRPPGALGSPSMVAPSVAAFQQPMLEQSSNVHNRIRRTERLEMSARADGARQWYASRGAPSTRAAMRAAAIPAVGDQMQLNANLLDYCGKPSIRTGRVVGVTTRTVVVTDNVNPAGLTDSEYMSFGVSFDTLVYSLDVSNFGAPVDIDSNGGRVILFFTHSVNELGGGVLGAFWGRDLLPKAGPLGSCPGSNVAEIMYLMVPDDHTSKDYVGSNTLATSAHEFQHLINESRRLYVNANAAPTEEVWLNEGLSHIAEELLFYRTTGLTPRENLGLAIFSPAISRKFVDYQFNNFARFREYVKFPESQSPIGVNGDDDDLATRGAAWSFLRFAADQRFASNETLLWFNLVNSKNTGLENLYEVVGADTRLLMRDWTLSVFLDDLVPTHPRYQQPSWNMRQVITGYAPFAPALTNGQPSVFSLRAAGTVFGRFGLAPGQEGYVAVSGSGGGPLSRNVRLALVRTR